MIETDTHGRSFQSHLTKVYQRHDGKRWREVRIAVYGYNEAFQFSYNILDSLTECIDVARKWNEQVGELIEPISEG